MDPGRLRGARVDVGDGLVAAGLAGLAPLLLEGVEDDGADGSHNEELKGEGPSYHKRSCDAKSGNTNKIQKQSHFISN